MTDPAPERDPFVCRFCHGEGFVRRIRPDGREVREPCIECGGSGKAAERRAA